MGFSLVLPFVHLRLGEVVHQLVHSTKLGWTVLVEPHHSLTSD